MPGNAAMILAAQDYCQQRLATFKRIEWRDPRWDNIPKPKLNTSYHLVQENALGISNNHDNQVMQVQFTVRLPFAPTRKPLDIADAATDFADTVIADFINPRNRLTQTNGLKNVTFNTMLIEPLADSNDNGVWVLLKFTMMIVTSTR
jgi:hypothetical protein